MDTKENKNIHYLFKADPEGLQAAMAPRRHAPSPLALPSMA
jgi:hypothetical protein